MSFDGRGGAAIGSEALTRTIIEKFTKCHGCVPDLQHPTTFSEKVQHRKLYERDPRMAALSDKVAVKHFVSDALGPEWVIPLLWSGDSLAGAPRHQWTRPYVIKASHGCGWNWFVLSQDDEDWSRIEPAVHKWLGTVYGESDGEWLYTQIPPKVLVEPYLHVTEEYKFYVFGGRAEYVHVVVGGGVTPKARRLRCYDRQWAALPFRIGRYDLPVEDCNPPRTWPQMVEAAEKLAGDFPFVRIDMYEVDGRALFGEYTFYPSSGFDAFNPTSFDELFGKLWLMPHHR